MLELTGVEKFINPAQVVSIEETFDNIMYNWNLKQYEDSLNLLNDLEKSDTSADKVIWLDHKQWFKKTYPTGEPPRSNYMRTLIKMSNGDEYRVDEKVYDVRNAIERDFKKIIRLDG